MFEYGGLPRPVQDKKHGKMSEGFLKRAVTDRAASSPDPGFGKSNTTETKARVTKSESILQRRRGTFINHTPRTYEGRSLRRDNNNSPQCVENNRCRPYTLHQGSSDESTSASYNQGDRHSSIDSFHGGRVYEIAASEPAELDGRQMSRISSEQDKVWRSDLCERCRSPSFAKDRFYRPHAVTSRRHNESPTVCSSMSMSLTGDPKKRRRQTPYRIPKPQWEDFSRHAPLEPLVAQHRRKVTGSNVDTLSPQIHLDDIKATARFMAIDEYFRNMGESSEPAPEVVSDQQCPGQTRSENIPVPLELPVRSSSLEPAPTFPAEGLEVPNEPSLAPFEPNAERFNRPTNPPHSLSAPSLVSNFIFPCEDQYRPYKDQNKTRTNPRPRTRHPVLYARQASTISPYTARIAPPIPRHSDLIAHTKLSDFNHFIRETGPPPSPKKLQKKDHWGLPIRKIRSRKAGPSAPPALKAAPSIPSCTKQMTTSSGKKHLQIVVPKDVSSSFGAEARDVLSLRSRRDFAWTDEMLNPLASAPVESVIAGSPADGEAGPVATGVRRPRALPSCAAAVPVVKHPLAASREERTRSRKLRDLQRLRERKAGVKEERVSGEGVVEKERVDEEGHGEMSRDEGDEYSQNGVEARVARLDHLVREFSRELAAVVGLDACEGSPEPEVVLEAYRTLRKAGTAE